MHLGFCPDPDIRQVSSGSFTPGRSPNEYIDHAAATRMLGLWWSIHASCLRLILTRTSTSAPLNTPWPGGRTTARVREILLHELFRRDLWEWGLARAIILMPREDVAAIMNDNRRLDDLGRVPRRVVVGVNLPEASPYYLNPAVPMYYLSAAEFSLLVRTLRRYRDRGPVDPVVTFVYRQVPAIYGAGRTENVPVQHCQEAFCYEALREGGCLLTECSSYSYGGHVDEVDDAMNQMVSIMIKDACARDYKKDPIAVNTLAPRLQLSVGYRPLQLCGPVESNPAGTSTGLVIYHEMVIRDEDSPVLKTFADAACCKDACDGRSEMGQNHALVLVWKRMIDCMAYTSRCQIGGRFSEPFT
ncbi:hypothetical protein P170DRAFT_429197 [Aspergillus steynii IBT 23096]|uniref:Uncharacterized protein n=1 Tax=Aspergillus steynii IBT 23096 TaxID=1392250 RepID=A0A2I2FZI5_9EURO|nr:uncharacterized protein P170DRAFT_429197 [Aspergillus steynii IBT 23096]PLB46042.1 hypothetical protein P170DRAFT_429197 [Aspergillus steynii IBT 23096]